MKKITIPVNVSVVSHMTDLIPDPAPERRFDSVTEFAPGYESNITGVNDHFDFMRDSSTYSGEGDTDDIEFGTNGVLTVTDSTVEIRYRENEQLGMSGIESLLRFRKDSPGMINLIRKGASPTSMIFDGEIRRRLCTYSIGEAAFDFVIITNSVTNEFSNDRGVIKLDYVIEIHGVETEHNVYTLTFSPKEG